MTGPRFGDRVRIAAAPETEASGFAGRAGEIWGESVPSVSGVGPVIGDHGEDLAFSVFFEDTEDMAWFAPHLVRRGDRVTAGSLRAPLVFLAALVLIAATAVAGLGSSTVHPLAVVSADPPCFPVSGYVTSGAVPNVRGRSPRAMRTNVALRRAVVTEQRRYAATARRYAAPNGRGIYETRIDQQLTSASTVVVSTLIPALKLDPSGNAGQTWIPATVEVRSGRTVALPELLANPSLALPVLVRDWKARLHDSTLWPYVARDPAAYTPTFAHYRDFALTPAGLAFGFAQGPAGPRFAAVVPYRLVRPYLSPLGRRLVAGVRPPRPPRDQRQGALSWAGVQNAPPAGIPASWSNACT